MKKQYQTPLIEINHVYALCGSVDNTSNVVGTEDTDFAKSRTYDEDNDAYNVTGGDGMSSYGDLW